MKKLNLTDEQAGMLQKIFIEGTGPFAWAELIADIRAQLNQQATLSLVKQPETEGDDAGS